ncbi:Rtel1 [Symbiodinium natans]|uniref:Rtel1 protein n=1 Tax=Symbiodinium natans TaxID=878477 RepID=A0A812QSK5_9DINO|nr:Rtel1 [Symbiodinium natans]
MQRVRTNRRRLLGSSSSDSKKAKSDCSKAFVQLNRPVESPAMAIPMSVPVSSLPSTADDQARLPLAATQASAAAPPAATGPAETRRQWKDSSDARGTVVEKLRERLDTLRDPRPVNLDMARCKHELRLGEDALYFPFPPMPPQCQVAAYAVRACDRGGIAMLQSPTGTGKSLALLCSTLAWQRRRLLATGSAPQILYGVRTHAQLSQIVTELTKSAYRPRMAVIGSRDQLCNNGLVKAQAAQRQVALSLACRQAARQAVARSRTPGDCGCELYAGLGNARFAERIHEQCGQGGRIWDVEDLTNACSRGSDRGCPYYSSHVLAGDADIVFCPHNYILDPAVSKCRSHHRERWSLEGRIIVIDEAHNLEQACREAGSLQISLPELRQICRALRQMPQRHDMRFGSDGKNWTCAQAAAELERLPLQIAAWLEAQHASDTPRPLRGAVQRLWGLEAPAQPGAKPAAKPGEAASSTRDFLQSAGLTCRKLLSKGMEDWGCHQDGFGFEVSRIPELMSECFVLQQWYGGHFA